MQIVTNYIRTDPQPRCQGLFDPIELFFSLVSQSHRTQHSYCVYIKGVYDVSYRIEEKVFYFIYEEISFNFIDTF